MKRLALILVICLILTAAQIGGAGAGARPGGKNGMYLVYDLTGGGTDALDSLDITAATTPNTYDLTDGDTAIAILPSGFFYAYRFDGDGTDVESSPDVIRPDDYSSSGVWLLTGSGQSSVILSTLTAAPAHTEGLLFYVSGDYGPSFYNAESDTRLNIGFENWKIVRNNTGDTITDGTPVYISGSIGQIPTIAPARADSYAASRAIGAVTHDVENNTIDVVTTFGVVHDYDTSAFDDGDFVYLGATGGITDTQPEAPYYAVQIGHIDYAHNEHGTLEIQIERLANLAPYSSTWAELDQEVSGRELYNKIEAIALFPLHGFLASPVDASDHLWYRVDRPTTVTDIHCIATGTGTITLTVQECDSAGANCSDTENAITCDSDGAEDDGTLSDASWDAGDWIKILYGAPAGTVDAVSWSVLIE